MYSEQGGHWVIACESGRYWKRVEYGTSSAGMHRVSRVRGLVAIISNKILSVANLQTVGEYRPWSRYVEEPVRDRGVVPSLSRLSLSLHVPRFDENIPLWLVAFMAAFDFVLMSALHSDDASTIKCPFAMLVPAFFLDNVFF